MRDHPRIDRPASPPPAIVALAAIALVLAAALAPAAVVRLQIDAREEITGERFNPAVGAYEKLTGLIHLEVDPDDPANALITDLHLAPRNAHGHVEFTTEFELYQPVDQNRGNGRLMYFVNNRGNRHGAGFFSNGLDYNWLWTQGYSYLWCGWACDVTPSDRRLNIEVPVATHGREQISGRVYAQMINYADDPVPSLPLTWGGSIPHAAISVDNTGAELSRHRYPWDEPESIPNTAWSFARVENGKVVSDPRHLYIEAGIDPGWLYELVYTSQAPPLTGLGLASIRDVVSFFRYAAADQDGVDNPLAGHVKHAYSWGHSQSGRLLLHFVWQGFNDDEAGRMVFDGVLPNCPGAGKGQFNSRFAQTTRHGSHLEDNRYPVDFFPLAFEKQTDPVTGKVGHALGLAWERHQAPKVMVLNSSTDYWTRAASLLHTDVAGTRDAEIDPSVRIYLLSGIAHTEGRAGVVGRALLTALDAWVTDDVPPPDSRIPLIADGTLVDLAAVKERFPAIPGLRLPESFYHPYRLDPGPRWETEGIADIVPPLAGPRFVCLVPQVDVDGNEIAGIRMPEIEVPLATFCGWRLRNPQFSNSLGRNSGRVWPLPTDAAGRAASGDQRAAIADRYGTPDAYLSLMTVSLADLLADRLILPADHDRMLAAAAERAALVRRLRPLEEILVGESTDDAVTWFTNVREASLDWYYGPSLGYAINVKGYELMSAAEMELAEKVFVVNTRLYPNDGNVWDSLAECYFNQERWQEARLNYEQSLVANPSNDNARAMLERIAGME